MCFLVQVAQNNPKVTPDDPTYFYWLYGYLEFKMTESEEVGMKKAVKQIDRLVEKVPFEPFALLFECGTRILWCAQLAGTVHNTCLFLALASEARCKRQLAV